MNCRRLASLALVIGMLCFSRLGYAEEPVPPSPDAPGQGMTLEELIALAESSSPTLRLAAAAVESARGNAVQVGLYPNPLLSSGAQQFAGNQSQYFGALSQEIITKHKLKLNREAASRQALQAEQNYIATRFKLLTEVRRGYMMALASQRRNEVLVRMVEIAGRSKKSAEDLQKAGEGTRTDSLLFEIEFERSEVALENSETKLNAARRQLAAVLGLRDLEIGRINGNLQEPLTQVEMQVLIDGYLPYNASVHIAELEIDRSKFLIRRAEVEPFPNVTVYAGYQRQVDPVHDQGMLSLSVPLPIWNQNQGNITSAYANLSKAHADVEVVQNSIARQMAELAGRYRIADQQVHRYEEKIVPKAREGVKIIQDGFAQGQFDFLRLLQAQRALVESTLGLIDALEARWDAAAELAGQAQLEEFP